MYVNACEQFVESLARESNSYCIKKWVRAVFFIDAQLKRLYCLKILIVFLLKSLCLVEGLHLYLFLKTVSF